MSSYISPKVKREKSDKSGEGLYAKENIIAGEAIVDYALGTGQYITDKESEMLYESGLDHMIQVGDNLFFAATTDSETEDADYLNHSCDPNCGIKGRLKIVAMRNIAPGEEITIDYAMSESSEYKFSCNCGSRLCRKIVTGDDWKIKELQYKYSRYFSDYLERKIDKNLTLE